MHRDFIAEYNEASDKLSDAICNFVSALSEPATPRDVFEWIQVFDSLSETYFLPELLWSNVYYEVKRHKTGCSIVNTCGHGVNTTIHSKNASWVLKFIKEDRLQLK